MGRKPIQIDLNKVEEYAKFCDNEEEIALALGISYRTFQYRKKEYCDFCEAIKRGKSKANVFVGGKLMQLVREGNPAATIFYMKARCGWKDVERKEITGKDGKDLSVAPVLIIQNDLKD